MVAVEDVISEQDTSDMMGGVLSSVLQPKQPAPISKTIETSMRIMVFTVLLRGVSASLPPLYHPKLAWMESGGSSEPLVHNRLGNLMKSLRRHFGLTKSEGKSKQLQNQL